MNVDWLGPLFALVEELSVFEEHGAVGSGRRRAGLAVAAWDVHVAVLGDIAATFELLPRDAAEVHHCIYRGSFIKPGDLKLNEMGSINI